MATRLVGSGGADRGVINAAALVAIAKSQIKIDAIFATSVGILNCWAFVLGVWDELEQVWKKEVKVKSKLQKLNLRGLAKGLIKNSPYLFEDEFIRELVDRYITPENYRKVVESLMDFEFPVFNLGEGRVEIISNRDGIPFEKYKKLVLAAISVPALYPAREIEGVWYADAGFIDNVGLFPALRNASSKDTVIILHNFPKEPLPMPLKYKSWLKVLWRSTESKLITNTMKDTNIYGAILRMKEDLVERIEKLIPEGFIFRRKNLRKKIVAEVNVVLESIILLHNGNLPLVKRKIDIFPPSHLSLFKTSTPSQKDLKDAFDEMFVFAEEFLKQEFPAN